MCAKEKMKTVVERFLEECCERVEDGRELSQTLHEAYTEWAEAAQAKQLTPIALGMALTRLGIPSGIAKGGKRVRLKLQLKGVATRVATLATTATSESASDDPFEPPEHLREPTKEWWRTTVADFELEDHHLRLLRLACEAWDRGQEAREALVEHGLTYEDRFLQPKARPEVAIERDSRLAFARLLRELALDVADPDHSRPPGLRGTG